MTAKVKGTTSLSLSVARSRYSNCPDQETAYPGGSLTERLTAACMSVTTERRSRPRTST